MAEKDNGEWMDWFKSATVILVAALSFGLSDAYFSQHFQTTKSGIGTHVITPAVYAEIERAHFFKLAKSLEIANRNLNKSPQDSANIAKIQSISKHMDNLDIDPCDEEVMKFIGTLIEQLKITDAQLIPIKNDDRKREKVGGAVKVISGAIEVLESKLEQLRKQGHDC